MSRLIAEALTEVEPWRYYKLVGSQASEQASGTYDIGAASKQNRILTTHVGSLVRPPKLVAFLEEIEAGRPYAQAAHAACLRQCIADVVRQQAEAGVDIVSDGEFGKTENWAWYVHERISGFVERPATDEEMKDPLVARSMGQDFKDFAEFYAEYFPTQNLKPHATNVTTACTGPIRYTGQALVQRDIENLKAAVARVQVVDAFLPLVAPASARSLAEFIRRFSGRSFGLKRKVRRSPRRDYGAVRNRPHDGQGKGGTRSAAGPKRRTK